MKPEGEIKNLKKQKKALEVLIDFREDQLKELKEDLKKIRDRLKQENEN